MALSFIAIVSLIVDISLSDLNETKEPKLTDPSAFLDKLAELENFARQQDSSLKQLQSETKILDERLSSKDTGSTYVRWGRKQCPSRRELVYSGFTGGGSYHQSGSASEYVCLPPKPKLNDTSGQGQAHMVGARYETNFWASNSHDEEVPCALCRTSYATTIMIPGTNTCSSGWTTEYHGYLASGYYDYPAASSYVCVDISPQFYNFGYGYTTGKLFYNVIAKCGSLSCPPYKNNFVLTCVVCSK